uniref:Glycosyltransferase Family 2 Protein n=1 Tax=Florenciella sp. virus SA2 TaxID=3240092 RepID=A0AB39JEN3_9VIRU
MSKLVSVIIPTYNRFEYLLNALESVKNQTYKNIEIIIVNDGSSQMEYYNYKFENCIVIHLDKNSKERFGHASPGGYQRSQGMKISSGEYIAFIDDDDYWLPNKLEKQIDAMETSNCLISSTDAYFGQGVYDENKKYVIYNKEKYQNIIKNIFNRNNKGQLMKDGFPLIWTKEFMNSHNCCIASSVVIHKSVIDKVGYFSNQLWAPDYEYWKRVIEHSDLIYIDEPLLYWDSLHGGGQNY